MIELKNDSLVFTFPEVHPDAALTMQFQRTLRIPDDEGVYPLPPGLGTGTAGTTPETETAPTTWTGHAHEGNRPFLF